MRVDREKNSDGVRVQQKKEQWVRIHHEKKNDRVTVDHEKKSDGVRVGHEKKERWGES